MNTKETVGDPRPSLLVTAGRCRQFMRSLASPDTWPILFCNAWGGHVHRSILAGALSEASDEELIDLIPYYVQTIMDDPNHRISEKGQVSEEEREAQAYRLAEVNLRHMDHDSEDILAAWESSQGYFGQGEVPWFLAVGEDELSIDGRRARDFFLGVIKK